MESGLADFESKKTLKNILDKIIFKGPSSHLLWMWLLAALYRLHTLHGKPQLSSVRNVKSNLPALHLPRR